VRFGLIVLFLCHMVIANQKAGRLRGDCLRFGGIDSGARLIVRPYMLMRSPAYKLTLMIGAVIFLGVDCLLIWLNCFMSSPALVLC
jgi:hypothetical protein